MKVVAIIVAAGSGKRMGRSKKKQFLSIGSKPILAYTL
ncbi:MAG: 2-C-methyl-D-erythritol 4-phosphate cytidylyltransferase, partial [Elusimicrobiota bacterium]|nr:2-C-methyl-D-erythritol 4-phosphate cytidylyltransferase [Elusimicrobiota bacterium]